MDEDFSYQFLMKETLLGTSLRLGFIVVLYQVRIISYHKQKNGEELNFFDPTADSLLPTPHSLFPANAYSIQPDIILEGDKVGFCNQTGSDAI
jgi:hypothetical protein